MGTLWPTTGACATTAQPRPATVDRMLRRPVTVVFLCLATLAGACSASVSDDTLSVPNSDGEDDANNETSTLPSPTAEPTPTPEPTPIPALGLPDPPNTPSALTSLTLGTDLTSDLVKVTIDGEVVAATGGENQKAGDVVASVWVPPGESDVCVYGASNPSEDRGPSPLEPTDVVLGCSTVTGTVGAPEALLPEHRIIAYYGVGAIPGLGVMGEGTPQEATERLLLEAKAYEPFGKPVLPAFEYIASVAQAQPMDDGSYSLFMPFDEIDEYLAQIRSVGGILVLDIQPGRTSFLKQAKELERFLMEPDVHLALDPEWAMTDTQVPGRVIGMVTANQVNRVLDYVSSLIDTHGLPEKLVIVHQFQERMINNRDRIKDPENIDVLFHVDGQGPIGAKYETYDVLAADEPYYMGFKVFFDEDSRVMTADEVMAIEPQPIYVSYQ